MPASNWIGANPRKEKAEKHIIEMEQKWGEQIQNSILNTKIYDDEKVKDVELPKWEGKVRVTPMHMLTQATTDDMVYSLYETNTRNKKTAILNFASYKNPGGAFIDGAMAQEEALCHTSTLYNVISKFENTYYAENRNNLNRGLYTNKALYSPNVIFQRQGESLGYPVDVITCALPNNSIGLKYTPKFTPEENEQTVLDRIRFVRDICLKEGVNQIVLGAWGCGVFNQNPEIVAKGFQDIFKNTGINCIYAIPDDKNYNAFRKALQVTFEKDTDDIRDFLTVETIPVEKANKRYEENYKNAFNYLEQIAKDEGIKNYRIEEEKNGYPLKQNNKDYITMDVTLKLYDDDKQQFIAVDVMNFDILHLNIDFFPQKDIEETLEEIEL